MQITQEQIKQFQNLYEKRFGVSLSDAEAYDQAIKLVGVFALLSSTEKLTSKPDDEK